MNRVFEYEGLLYKKCNNCNVTKEVKDFKSNGYNKTGTKIYKPFCKYCYNLIQRNRIILDKRYKENKNQLRREWAANNKEKVAKYARDYYNSLDEIKYKKLLKRHRAYYHKNK